MLRLIDEWFNSNMIIILLLFFFHYYFQHFEDKQTKHINQFFVLQNQ